MITQFIHGARAHVRQAGRRLGNSGDTIVEVMIVLAILGMAMSVSYATANKGLQKSRTAQEHSEALGIINGQIELLRASYAKQNAAAVEARAALSPFCLSNPPGPYDPPNINAITNIGVNAFNENLQTDKLNQTPPYPAACRQNSLYNTSITGRGNGIYDLRVRWDGIGQLGRQQEEVTYRIGNVALTPTSNYTDAQNPPPPPFSGVLNVQVKAIPPAAGNTTPSCAAAATQSKSGTTVRLYDNTTGGTLVGTKSTDINSLASFTGIQQGDTFTATISRSGFGVCPSGSTGVATTTTPFPVIPKTIYPICTTNTVTTYGWVWGNRRADLDGYYYTIPPAVPNGTYPGAFSSFYAGNYRAGGTFVYVWSGDSSRAKDGLLYYWLWEVSWAPISTVTTNSCPS